LTPAAWRDRITSGRLRSFARTNFRISVSLCLGLKLNHQFSECLADAFGIGLKVLLGIDWSALDHFTRERDRRHCRHGAHLQTLGNLLELSGGLAASVAPVADDYDGLSVPFFVEVIERIFKRGGITPVVLRRDDYNGVSAGDLAAPSARVLLSIGAELRDAGLIV